MCLACRGDGWPLLCATHAMGPLVVDMPPGSPIWTQDAAALMNKVKIYVKELGKTDAASLTIKAFRRGVATALQRAVVSEK